MLWTTVDWAFSKTSGTGQCLIEWCENRDFEIGEHFNITVWAEIQRHRFFTGRKHRKAVIAYWQERKDRGLPVNPYVAKKLK